IVGRVAYAVDSLKIGVGELVFRARVEPEALGKGGRVGKDSRAGANIIDDLAVAPDDADGLQRLAQANRIGAIQALGFDNGATTLALALALRDPPNIAKVDDVGLVNPAGAIDNLTI